MISPHSVPNRKLSIRRIPPPGDSRTGSHSRYALAAAALRVPSRFTVVVFDAPFFHASCGELVIVQTTMNGDVRAPLENRGRCDMSRRIARGSR